MPTPLVTIVCGGLGGARVAMALQALGIEADTCFVTNVGDDVDVDGLLVCPDTDAVLYALTGVFDEARGWGVRDDEFPVEPTGEMAWFKLGRRDRRHHQRRQSLLETGMGLASATAELCREYGITASVVPVTDDRVRTVVDTDSGPLDWQEWLVRDGAEPDVRGVRYSGAVDARIHPDAATALATADLLVIAPSSPVASVGPVLAVPGCTEAVSSRTGPTVALSPVSRRPVGRDRDRRRAVARAKVMAAVELGHDPSGVAAFYRGMVDELVVDTADEADVPTLRADGTAAWSAPIVEVDELVALFAGPLDPRDLSARSG